MKKYLLIGAGGFTGATLRFYIKGIHIYGYRGTMPLNTLLINVIGCFILGLFLTAALEVFEIDTDIRLCIATGLLGAFTTFSTLCKETYLLISQGNYYSAVSYVTISAMLGITAVYFGVVLAREVISKYTDKKDKDSPYAEFTTSNPDEEVS